MLIGKLKDHQLLKNTLALVKIEKNYTHQILTHLMEIDRRRLYSDLSYPSLFKYVVKELKYSDAEAQVRIQAMRLMKGSRFVEKNIKDGSLNLTQAATVQSALLKKEREDERPVSTGKAKKIIQSILGKSTTETRKILDKTLNLKKDKSVKLTLPEYLVNKIERLKIFFGEDLSELEIIDALVEEKLKRPKEKKVKKEIQNVAQEKFLGKTQGEFQSSTQGSVQGKIQGKIQSKVLNKIQSKALNNIQGKTQSRIQVDIQNKNQKIKKSRKSRNYSNAMNNGKQETTRKTTRYIPIDVKREVWEKSKGRCKQCGGFSNLEYEHIRPYSWFKYHNPKQMILLCKNCNLRSAIKAFGQQKMDFYLSKSKL